MQQQTRHDQVTRWQFTTGYLLFLFTGLSLLLTISVAAQTQLASILVATLILLSRPFLITRPRSVAIALPLLVFTIAAPIALSWDQIVDHWHTTKRPDPLSDWITWAIAYPLLPIAAWLIDFWNNWKTTRTELIRLVFDFPLLFAWFIISAAILIDMGSSHT